MTDNFPDGDSCSFDYGANRVIPTMRQLITGTIVGIASHPRIIKPGIFFPYSIGGQPQQEVKIERFRSFGGIELETPGLTCSVYPLHTARDSIDSTPIMSPSADYAQMYRNATLGRNTDATAIDEVTTYLVVELAYQDSEFDRPIDYLYTQAESLELQLANHSYQQMLTDERLGVTEDFFDIPPFDKQTTSLVNRTVTISTNIGEAILSEYMDLMRLVLNDLPTLRPFSVRATQVKAIDYSTSNWLNRGQNINFHQAYLIWEVSMFVSKSWRDIYFTPIRTIDINGKAVLPENIINDLTQPNSSSSQFVSNSNVFTKKKVIEFTNARLTVANLLIARHDLETITPSSVIIWTNDGQIILPDQVRCISLDTIVIDLTSFVPFIGTWTLIIGVV